MTVKKSKRVPRKKPSNENDVLQVTADTSEKSTAQLRAEIAYDPTARSLAGARLFIKNTMGEQPLTESLHALAAHVKEVRAGNLAIAEKTLVAQANTLDAIFNELARRAALNMGEYIDATDTYLRLALKAQSQCRATLETLAYIKNPPTAFIRQQNVAVNQQVNNSDPSDPIPTNSRIPARVENEKTGNELLSGGNHATLDSNRTSTTVGINSQLETVGALHRCDYAKR